MQKYYAECTSCKKQADATPHITTCASCGGILDIKYDYDAIKKSIGRKTLEESRDRTMWRYRAFLPVSDETDVTGGLRVGNSPLYKAERLGEETGLFNLYIKDDGFNPTSSLKDRASAMAVVKAAEAGASVIACASTGNAASSLAGSAAKTGFGTYIFVPSRAPRGKVTQLLVFGAKVISVDGSYEETFRLSAAAIERWGWYNRNAAINPFLMEGKKTVSFEIAEQLNWEIPDYVAVSVGDGCTAAGVWKGFYDLYAAGLTDKLPRLISVQAEGCSPINNAVEAGCDKLVPTEENTIADSIAVGVPRNFLKAVMAIRQSNGITVNVSDREILDAIALMGKTTGVFAEPAGAAGTAGVIKARGNGLIPKDASVVSIVTGNGLKDIKGGEKAAGSPILVKPDMNALLDGFEKAGVIPDR